MQTRKVRVGFRRNAIRRYRATETSNVARGGERRQPLTEVGQVEDRHAGQEEALDQLAGHQAGLSELEQRQQGIQQLPAAGQPPGNGRVLRGVPVGHSRGRANAVVVTRLQPMRLSVADGTTAGRVIAFRRWVPSFLSAICARNDSFCDARVCSKFPCLCP